MGEMHIMLYMSSTRRAAAAPVDDRLVSVNDADYGSLAAYL